MQGAVTRGNFIPFILKNQKFRLENKMDGVIPFEKLQKKLAVIVATFLLKGGLYQMMSLWRFPLPDFGDCAVGTEIVPAVIESFLIKKRRFAKGIFIYRDFGQPFVNGLWDVFDDAGWMVRFLVDIGWNFCWFVVWQVLSVSQVKCDVKEVCYFLIGLDSNLQTVLS